MATTVQIGEFANKMLNFMQCLGCNDTDIQMLQECQKELSVLSTMSGSSNHLESTIQRIADPSLLDQYEEANEACTQLELVIKAEARAAEDIGMMLMM